jgi:hypothetical protein
MLARQSRWKFILTLWSQCLLKINARDSCLTCAALFLIAIRKYHGEHQGLSITWTSAYPVCSASMLLIRHRSLADERDWLDGKNTCAMNGEQIS